MAVGSSQASTTATVWPAPAPDAWAAGRLYALARSAGPYPAGAAVAARSDLAARISAKQVAWPGEAGPHAGRGVVAGGPAAPACAGPMPISISTDSVTAAGRARRRRGVRRGK